MGAADVAALTSDEGYDAALDAAGGHGVEADVPDRRHRRARDDGVVRRGLRAPDRRAYTETCASVGNLLWGHRMFLLHGEARPRRPRTGPLQRLSLRGVALGRSVLRSELAQVRRPHRSSAYFDVACCPANLSRLMEQVPGLLYATRGTTSSSTSTGRRRRRENAPAVISGAEDQDIPGTAASSSTSTWRAARVRDQPPRAGLNAHRRTWRVLCLCGRRLPPIELTVNGRAYR